MFFQKLERVEFRDTDAAGIAHFSVFFNWMERSEHAFLRHLGWSVVHSGGDHKISWPRVSARCDYVRPVRFEDVFGVQIDVARLGRSSCTYRFRFLDAGGVKNLAELVSDPFGGWTSGQDWFQHSSVSPFAQGAVTAVCCRIAPDQPHQSIEIPGDWRNKLEPFCHSEEDS